MPNDSRTTHAWRNAVVLLIVQLVWVASSARSATLAIGDAEIARGPMGVDVVLSFPVTLSETGAVAVTVDFAASNGLAMAGVDYVATNGALSLPAGSCTGQVDVIVPGANADQWPSLDLYLNLSNISNATFADDQAHGVIVVTNDTPETKIWTGLGDWTSRTNWTPAGALPSPSDSVFIKSGTCIVSSATTYVPSLIVSNGATMIFSNWMSAVRAGDFTIRNTALVTHIPCDTNIALGNTNRVYIVCTNLTIDSGGKIDASGRGFRGATNTTVSMRGQGPGGGYHQCGGGYGGVGGLGAYAVGVGTPGPTYGSLTMPEDPGSGGGTHNSFYPGADGGGAVRIEASELVTINGTIAAHGIGMSGQGNGGSGGSIYIRCLAMAGSNGVIGADGGDNLTGYDYVYSGGSGGGGRVALDYDKAAQSNQNLSAKPFLTISASQGYGWYPGGPGSLSLSDASFFPHPATLSGGCILIPDFTVWTATNLVISNGMAVFPDGFRLSVSNRLTACGIGGGLLLTNGSLHVDDDMTVTGRTFNFIYLFGGTASEFHVKGNLSMWSGRFHYYDAPTTNINLVVGGNLFLTNGAAFYAYSFTNVSSNPFAACVRVTSNMLMGGSSWVYPISEPTNGASGRFIIGGNLTVDTNSGFCADASGYAGGNPTTNRGCGPGAGAGSAGAGYGGAGGLGAYSPKIPGGAYGDSNAPSLPGSGGGMHVPGGGFGGGRGGGLIWIEVAKTLSLDGALTANGGRPGYYQSGGGAGGGIYVICRRLVGSTTAVVRANGYSATINQYAGGGGGGGRIAILRSIDRFQGAVTADGGLGYIESFYGGAGTVVWRWYPPRGTVFAIQ